MVQTPVLLEGWEMVTRKEAVGTHCARTAGAEGHAVTAASHEGLTGPHKHGLTCAGSGAMRDFPEDRDGTGWGNEGSEIYGAESCPGE